jgi:hypothetical protein
LVQLLARLGLRPSLEKKVGERKGVVAALGRRAGDLVVQARGRELGGAVLGGVAARVLAGQVHLELGADELAGQGGRGAPGRGRSSKFRPALEWTANAPMASRAAPALAAESVGARPRSVTSRAPCTTKES